MLQRYSLRMGAEMQSLDPKQTRAFLAATTAGTVRGAAEALGVEPSTISRAITGLETTLATRLIERGRRGVQLTEAGALLRDHLRREASEMEALQSRFDALKGMARGTVRVAVGEGFVGDLVGGALPGFAATHPGLTYALEQGSTDAVRHSVMTDQAHLGLAYDVAPDRALKLLARHPQPLMMLARPGSRFADLSAPLSMAALANLPAAVLTGGYGVGSVLARAEARAGHRLHAVVETGSIAVLLAFARSGMGVTVLPRFAAMADIAAGGLVAREIAEPEFQTGEAALIARNGRELPRAAQSMAANLARRMAAFGGQ
jgi:DNA-binding transcriptional LysR family regulator